LLFGIIIGPGNGGEPLPPCNDYIVVPTGTMDNEQVTVLVPPAYDTNVFIAGIKHQIAGLGFTP